ncbi:uncharacterized protein [Phaseolus vulgaris]|uniref:uncharacterized protein n=1 Tax=Phaseolus vulgaris TaxID=3885 RepID=UPI0035CA605C
MRVLFDYHELWDVVESEVSALGDNATEAQRVARDQKKNEYKALYLIHQGMNDETFEQIEGATTAMKSNGETHSEQAKVEKILRSLTPRFEHVVAAIEETNDISKMTVSSYQEHGSYFSKGRGGQHHGGAWRGERGRGGRGGIYNKSNVECYNCHKRDNHAANCAQEESNHEQDEEDHAVLMAATSNETPNNQTWYLDTGCTNHMCGKKELFADLDDSFRTKVKFGDGRTPTRSGIKPNVQHLKVFGSITYAHVPKTARSKLDDKAVKTIFIGYKEESEPVRLVDAIQHPKWQKDMNEELMAIEKNNIISQIGKVVPNQN